MSNMEINETSQIVVFSLMNINAKKREFFGVEIGNVQEIRLIEEITSVPEAPPYILGIINLRGKIINLIDLRIKLGYPPLKDEEEKLQKKRILVADINGIQTGLLVDEVEKVLKIQEQDIELEPSENSKSSNFVKGVVKNEEQLILLLNLEKLLEEKEVPLIKEPINNGDSVE